MTERYFTFMLQASEKSGFQSSFEMVVFGDVDEFKDSGTGFNVKIYGQV